MPTDDDLMRVRIAELQRKLSDTNDALIATRKLYKYWKARAEQKAAPQEQGGDTPELPGRPAVGVHAPAEAAPATKWIPLPCGICGEPNTVEHHATHGVKSHD